MKQFACGAVVPGCTATFTGQTQDEILGKVADHARHDHGIDAPPPELVDEVRARIEELVA